jgi:alkylation response protein AidB-like acyl-CoA dehydrogenase
VIDFNLSEEQQMLRDVVARFVREHYDLKAHRAAAASEVGFRRELWEQFAELGWLGLAQGEAVGGLGLSFVEVAIVMEELGRGLVLEPYLSSAVLCAHLLKQADEAGRGNPPLRALVAGKLFAALAHSEAGARYDLASVQETVATREGGGYRIEGRKTLALGAPAAEVLIVSARLADDPVGRFALFLVDPAAPGVSMESYPLIDYTRAADVRLAHVAVTMEAMLIGPQRALDALEEAVDLATLASVAEALGCMESILDQTAQHLKTRVQFGNPLGKFQALQHRMAEMFVEVQESRSILYQAIASLALGADARRTAISAAKAYVGNAGKLVGEHAIQLHGGIGVTEEVAVGHYYKKLVLFEKLFGDRDFHLDRFAKGRGY